jgi:hypothetical protein
MKVVDGKGIIGGFIFQNIEFPKYGGKLLVYNHIFLFAYDYRVNSEGFLGKGVFYTEIQSVLVLKQFQLDSIIKSRVPGYPPVILMNRRFAVDIFSRFLVGDYSTLLV